MYKLILVGKNIKTTITSAILNFKSIDLRLLKTCAK